jgi:hypothetical protein
MAQSSEHLWQAAPSVRLSWPEDRAAEFAVVGGALAWKPCAEAAAGLFAGESLPLWAERPSERLFACRASGEAFRAILRLMAANVVPADESGLWDMTPWVWDWLDSAPELKGFATLRQFRLFFRHESLPSTVKRNIWRVIHAARKRRAMAVALELCTKLDSGADYFPAARNALRDLARIPA